MKEQLWLELDDEEWPDQGTNHDRQIVRAIVYDDAMNFYFVHSERDDDFGRAALIETSGGGVEPGEALTDALQRELQEELGARVDRIQEIGLVSDYYHLIRRHNINHYYLAHVMDFGANALTIMEKEELHLKRLCLSYQEAITAYQNNRRYPLGRLIANREEPILKLAKILLEES